MKNINKLALLFLSVLLFSCETDLESLNVDKKNATTAAPEAFFANAVKEFADHKYGIVYLASGPSVARLWSQHLTSVTYLEGAIYIPDFSWTPMYADVLNNLKEAERILEETENSLPAEETERINKLAMIEIMTVYAYATLVEAYGNIPYSEALDYSNPAPKYDDAATVYTDLIERIGTAISNLDAGGSGFGSSDLIYNGDVEKWIKFGNSLKLRMGMRIIDALPEIGAEAVTAAASGAFDSNEDNALFRYLPDFPNSHPWWAWRVRQNLEYFVGTNTFIDLLNDLEDPRREIFFTPVEGEFVGAQYGIVEDYYSASREGAYFREPDLAAIFMDYAQVEFLLAEAAERNIGSITDAEAHYEAAIKASFDYYGIGEDEAEAYLSQPEVDYSSAEGPWQRKIGIQKWIHLFDQGFEAWTEYRRLDYPRLFAPEIAESDIVPRRFVYPISAQTLNPTGYQAAAEAIGGDTYSTRLFWDTE